MSNLQCPIDHVKVNENKVRMTALLVMLLGIFLLFTGNSFIILFLLADFFTRAFNLQNYSPLGWVAGLLIKSFKIPHKPTDRGPKRFAAGMGFGFIALIFIAVILKLDIISMVLTIMLCVFAFLESFAAFCVGCYLYTGLQKLRGLFA